MKPVFIFDSRTGFISYDRQDDNLLALSLFLQTFKGTKRQLRVIIRQYIHLLNFKYTFSLSDDKEWQLYLYDNIPL